MSFGSTFCPPTSQLFAGMNLSVETGRLRAPELGIVAPRLTLEWSLPHIEEMMTARATRHPFYETLETKAADIDGLSHWTRRGFLREAEDAIDDVVKPAYRRFYNAILAVHPDAPEALSLGQFPGGAEASPAAPYVDRPHCG